MEISMTRNEIIFLLSAMRKVKDAYENEGKYGSANVIDALHKAIKEQTNIR